MVSVATQLTSRLPPSHEAAVDRVIHEVENDYSDRGGFNDLSPRLAFVSQLNCVVVLACV